MYQRVARQPVSLDKPVLGEDLFEAMWQIFVHIGRFWKNMADPEPVKTQFYNFLLNRIRLRPIYYDYYVNAQSLMARLIDELGEEKAYELLFTAPDATKAPSETPLAAARQNVANEFMAWQLALGGFKVWGAINYCGYIGGAYLPGEVPPYRTFED